MIYEAIFYFTLLVVIIVITESFIIGLDKIKIHTLKNDVIQKDKDIEIRNETIARLSNDINTLNREIKTLVQSSKNQNTSLSNNIQRLNSEIQIKDTNIIELKNIINEHIQNIQRLEQEIQCKIQEIQSKNEQIENYRVMVDSSNDTTYNIQHLIEVDIPSYKRKLKILDGLEKELGRYKNIMTKGGFIVDNISDIDEYLELYNIAILDEINPIQESSTFKQMLDNKRKESKLLVKTNKSIRTSRYMDKTVKSLVNILMFVFDSICDRESVNIKHSNLEACEKRIVSCFDKLNKRFSTFGICITNMYLSSKLAELYIEHQYQVVRQSEKLKMQEVNKQIREEKRKQKEIETKQKMLEEQMEKELEQERIAQQYKEEMERQIERIKNSLEVQSKLKIDNETAIQNIEINKLRNELRELEQQLKDAQQESNVDSIEEQIIDLEKQKEVLQSGFVYVISNKGAFGENIYKIGVTRRDDPLERVRELSGASVPFRFSVHAIIPSDQAFKLEYNIHKQLNRYRVNLINNRKEFFNINEDELIKILGEIVGDISFNRDIVDEQYTDSLEIRQNKDKFESWLNGQELAFLDDESEETYDDFKAYKTIDEYTSVLNDLKSIDESIKLNMRVTKYYIAIYISDIQKRICTFYKCGDAKRLISVSIEGYESNKTSGTRHSIKMDEYNKNKEMYISIISEIIKNELK